jgi:hypothetical protein
MDDVLVGWNYHLLSSSQNSQKNRFFVSVKNQRKIRREIFCWGNAYWS